MSKSNQQATLHRVTLLESVAAARNAVQSCMYFHRDNMDESCLFRLREALGWMRDAEVGVIAAEKAKASAAEATATAPERP